MNKIANMRNGYINAMLWLADEEIDSDLVCITNLSIEAKGEIIGDCEKFYLDNAVVIERNYGKIPLRNLDYYGMVGHDLFLTRNGHGAGFWDRGYSNGDGDILTAASEKMGTMNIYLGDDNILYVV